MGKRKLLQRLMLAIKFSLNGKSRRMVSARPQFEAACQLQSFAAVADIQRHLPVIQARDAGVRLGFFGGNYLYWPTQFSPDSKGNPNRALAVDKTFGDDGTFAGSRYNESEQLIVGGMWGPGHNNTNGDIFVAGRRLAVLATPPRN